MSDAALLREFEPVVRFTHGELFFPSAVEPFVRDCSLWEADGKTRPELRVPAGELDLQGLVEFEHIPEGHRLYLRFVQKPASPREYKEWRMRPARPRFTAPGRHARVPLISRVIDACFDFSLLVRGTVPGGTTARAEMQYRQSAPARGGHVYYGRVLRQGGWIALQYLFFYSMNDWRSTFRGANDHEADWEQIFVFLYEPADGGSPVPQWVAYASHDYHGDDLRRRWDDPLLQKEGNHPVVFAGAGSHASYFERGEYVMRVEPTFLQPVKYAARRLRELWANTFGQGTRLVNGKLSALVSVPFVDYARGDGLAIGPGHEEWSPVIITDSTGWVDHYRGLWGLDTGDPFGGERAPAGPKYNRDGSVRLSWYDPMGWAGLEKVPPPPAMIPALDARNDELNARLADLDLEIESARGELRRIALDTDAVRATAYLGGLHQAKTIELNNAIVRLEALQAERVVTSETATASRTYRERIARGDWGTPQDHLHHVQHPDPPVQERRVLELWGAVSGALALLGFVALLVVHPRRWWLWAFGLALAMAVVEAMVRRRLIDLLLSIVIALAVFTAIVLVYEFWRSMVVLGLGALALIIMRDNLRELRGR